MRPAGESNGVVIPDTFPDGTYIVDERGKPVLIRVERARTGILKGFVRVAIEYQDGTLQEGEQRPQPSRPGYVNEYEGDGQHLVAQLLRDPDGARERYDRYAAETGLSAVAPNEGVRPGGSRMAKGSSPKQASAVSHASHDSMDEQLAQHLIAADPRVRRRIEEWARKLIDLSRRNRLLVYRPNKRSTLVFRHPGADAVVQRLIDGRSWFIYKPRPIPVQSDDSTAPKPPTLDELLLLAPPSATELVSDQRDPTEIERSLVAIGRKAAAEFEDRGTHTLHAIWSLLRWTDPGSEEAWTAPLVLIPLELKRKSIHDRFEFSPTEDDAIFNPALRVKLENDFGIKLPEMDLESMTLEEVLTTVRGALRTWSVSWEIQPYAAVGLFSFAKEAMYRDLVEHAEVVAQSAGVQSLALGAVVEGLRDALDVDVPSEETLDQSQKPKDVYSVLDADSSQRLAIEAAVRGQSFVLFGPPGTGKSQTIANIIAEFVARGRSVLFVSEKMAALEVVATRLHEAELGDLLLELHSAKSSRAEVTRQLARALDESAHADDRDFAPAATAFEKQRSRLNAYVAALHERRSPLMRSVYDVIGDLQALVSAPALPAGEVESSTLGLDDLDDVASSVARWADVWDPVTAGSDFVWRDATLTTFGPVVRQRTADLLAAAEVALEAMADLESEICRHMALPRPTQSADRNGIDALGALAASPAAAPIEWLTTDDLSRHRGIIDRWANATAERRGNVSRLVASYGEAWTAVTTAAAARVMGATTTLESVLGQGVAMGDLSQALAAISNIATHIVEELDRMAPAAERLRTNLGLRPRGDGLADLQILIDVARISQDRNRPLGAWLGRARLMEAERFVEAHGAEYEAERAATAALVANYDERILDLPLDALLDRMRRHHGRWWNLLRPSHRADRATLVGLTNIERLRDEILGDIEDAIALKIRRDAIASLSSEADATIGVYARGLDTDVDGLREALTAARRLMDLPHESTDWDVLGRRVTVESPYDPSIERDADLIVSGLGRIEPALAELGDFLAPLTKVALRGAPRSQLRSDLIDVTNAVSEVAAAATTFAIGRIERRLSFDEMRGDAEARLAIEASDTDLETTEQLLADAFHDRWAGFDTDWQGLGSALEWSLAVRRFYESDLVPPLVARTILSGEAANLPWDGYRVARAAYDATAAEVVSLYRADASKAVAADLGGVVERARSCITDRRDRIDQLDAWVRFQAIRKEISGKGWAEFAEEAIARSTPAQELEPAARKAWLDAWVRSAVESDSRLAGFSREEHERAVQAFRSADQTLIHVARERVLKLYEDGKPSGITLQGGEQAIVRQEAAKKRRLRPVRVLLGAIPNLLPRIKPCLMMSPLSVSHFLAPTMRFDLVVFDEASQVSPEDAINCIYRGRQLIVAGDPKQLPPTDFFTLSATIESDLDIETGVDDFESVLDLASGSGFYSRPLRWHYRSRDDSLIAFSNQVVYDGSLVTFPSPDRSGSELGVTFVHCRDGVFDRGRTARNPVEAKRVVEVVASELRRDPSNSIGVVAFSVAQQQAIEDEWERRIRLEPDLEELGGDSRLHGLFIKNLETVQGDERDVIVFSIGYGRDESGRMLMNFGPVNRQGGWRRLNVAVTRARRRVIVVSSIRSDDITRPELAATSGPPRGAEMLRAYLEYAERGTLPAVANNTASRGPADSAFERDVADVIRDLGWEIVTQVGTSGYRIDLGVVAKADPSRFLLGVECDGMMYHSAKTARDRDRLRQGVLEALGWRIHRIWSQDWYGRRGAAIQSLRVQLEAAESELAEAASRPQAAAVTRLDDSPTADIDAAGPEPIVVADGSATSDRVGSASRERPRQTREALDFRDKADALQLPWTVPYPVAELPEYSRTWLEFHEPGMIRYHASMLGVLVDAEGPVHREYAATRLARRYGLQRVGQRMADAVDLAIQEADRSGRLSTRGPFLWPLPAPKLDRVRVPVPGKPETARAIDRIPPEEIDLAILYLVETAIAIDEASLRTLTARVLGFDRTADRIGEHVDARLNANLEAGRLVAGHGGLTLGSQVRLPRADPPGRP